MSGWDEWKQKNDERTVTRWVKQMFCRHHSRAWVTEPFGGESLTMTTTTGGCVDCGKAMKDTCPACGR